MPHTLGTKTRTAIVYGPESHKLFLEFTKDDATVIEAGTPVVLDTAVAGQVKPAAAAGDITDIIGYSITGKNHTAYGKGLVTIACRGFMVVSGKASGAIPPGPVMFDSVNTEGVNVYKVSTGSNQQVGWAIVSAQDTEDVEVLLQ